MPVERPDAGATIETGSSSRPSFIPAAAFIVVGSVAGVVASWALLFGSIENAAPSVDFGIHRVLPAIGILAATLVLATPITWWVAHHFLKGARGTLEQVVAQAGAATESAIAGQHSTAARHAERALQEFVAWYGPVAARRWAVQTAFALLVSFGGLAGTALLFRQTLLLVEQNKKLKEQTDLLMEQNLKLDLQNVTGEAQRRAAIATEFFSILQALWTIVPSKTDGEQSAQPITLPMSLRPRVVAFSRAATPYWTVDVNTDRSGRPTPSLTGRQRSPERGQLLEALWLANIDIPADIEVLGADLRNRNLRRFRLNRPSLEEVDLSSSDLTEATISSVELYRLDLRQSNITRANISNSTIIETDISGSTSHELSANNIYVINSNFSNSTFSEAKMANLTLINTNCTRANFSRSEIYGGEIRDSNCTGSDFTRTNLSNSRFLNVNLKNSILLSANFTGTELSNIDWDGAIVGIVKDGSSGGADIRDMPIGWTVPLGWRIAFEGQLAVVRRVSP